MKFDFKKAANTFATTLGDNLKATWGRAAYVGGAGFLAAGVTGAVVGAAASFTWEPVKEAYKAGQNAPTNPFG